MMDSISLSYNLALIEGWLHALAQAVGMDTLTLDSNHCCHIKAAERFFILIKFDQVAQDLVLCTYVSDILVEPASSCLAQLMHWNHEGVKLMGGTLGLCPNHQRVTYTLRKALSVLDTYRFYNLVQNFIATSENLYDEIRLITSELPAEA